MNETKLNQLFAAARNEAAPVPAADFAADVLRAVRCVETPKPEMLSVFDQLNSLFPRLALAAAALILLCVAADWGLTAAGLPDVGDGATQAVSQYLFSAEEL